MNVLIDGENLRHRISEILVAKDRIRSQDSNAYFAFDVRYLLEKTLSSGDFTSTYYTTKIHFPKFPVPAAMTKRIKDIQEANRRWIARLSAQGTRIVKAGYLKVRDSSKCIHCGKKTLLLQEKGVDVRLSIDVVQLALIDQAKDIVVVSSDADIIPALTAAISAGANVIYLCWDEDINKAIASVASRTVTFDNRLVVEAFDRANKTGENYGK